MAKNAGFQIQWVIEAAEAVHPDFENPDVVVKFTGRDVELLLANKAELLLALEQLTMEMLRMTQDEHSMLQFDANDYRALRIEELRLSALTAAEKVKKSHLPFHFSPMNSRERRIIHLALRNEPAVRSESAGMGPNRQVVVYPADMPSLPSSSAGSVPSARPPPVIAASRYDRRHLHARWHERGSESCGSPDPDARSIAEQILRLPSEHTWKPWTATLATLVDEAGGAIDQVVATYFAAPRSYTAEDVIEIACHGAPVVLAVLRRTRGPRRRSACRTG